MTAAQDGIGQLQALARDLAALGPPVIVFNKSHSGSRLLARTLAAAGVYMGANRNESEDALELLPLVTHIVNLHYPDFSRLWSDGDPLLDRRVREAVHRHLAGRPPGARWGWKLCETTFALPVLARIFPDAWFLHLLRDGRDVAFSEFVAPDTPFLRKVYFGTAAVGGFRGLPLSAAGYRTAPHLFNARAWVEAVVAGRGFGAMLGARYREVRYETLATAPEATARDLCAFLDLRPPADAFASLAAAAHGRVIGRHRSEAPDAVADVVDILGTTLAAFGYGDGAEPPRARRFSVVVLGPADADAEAGRAVRYTLRGLARGGTALLEVLLAVQGPPPADLPMPVIPVVVPDGADEAAAAAAGLAAASGTHVLFARSGDRLVLDAVARLASQIDDASAIAAFGCLRSGSNAEPDYTPVLRHQEHLRWLDAVPPGAALFRRDRLLAAGAADGMAEAGAGWHWRLVRRAADCDLAVLSALPLAHARALPAAQLRPTTDMTARPVPAAGVRHRPDRRVIVCGAPDASLSLFFDGIPAHLRRHLRFLPQPASPRDLAMLAGAGAVILLRDFQFPLAFGVVDALRRMEVPFFYMADDHFPTLRAEGAAEAFYSSANLIALLALADGAIAATPALAEAFRPHARQVLLWPHTIDESLVPQAGDPAFDPPFRRVGMMGGSFRAEGFVQEVAPALAALAAERPLTLVAREDVVARAPGRVALHAMPFEPAFRRFVFLWRRARVDTIAHPRAVTANAPFKSPTALLTSLYLGALPIVPDEPAYDGIGASSGVTVVGTAGHGWRQALETTGDRDERARLQARLLAYCRDRFAPEAAAAALEVVLDAARPPDPRRRQARAEWLASRPALANLARRPEDVA